MNILLTGGLGYIGSHTAVSLTEHGHKVAVIDNLSNSSESALLSLRRLVGDFSFYSDDILDTNAVTKILLRENIDIVIHFAALKNVSDSVKVPINYYVNNVNGTISLAAAMIKANVNRLVFSSSAAVYGEPLELPIRETHSLKPLSPYGKTKLICESILNDLAQKEDDFKVINLRYFNPVGAHGSALIGDNPKGSPSNLMPVLCRVAAGIDHHVKVFGGDFDTADGSGLRDYIHIEDLADAHFMAARAVKNQGSPIKTFNVGTGTGVSVLEMLNMFRSTTGIDIKWTIGPRRAGDVAQCFANSDLIREELNWHPTRSLSEMCLSSWKFFQSQIS